MHKPNSKSGGAAHSCKIIVQSFRAEQGFMSNLLVGAQILNLQIQNTRQILILEQRGNPQFKFSMETFVLIICDVDLASQALKSLLE